MDIPKVHRSDVMPSIEKSKKIKPAELKAKKLPFFKGGKAKKTDRFSKLSVSSEKAKRSVKEGFTKIQNAVNSQFKGSIKQPPTYPFNRNQRHN